MDKENEGADNVGKDSPAEETPPNGQPEIMPKNYIGSKIIQAKPMNEVEFLTTVKGQVLEEGQPDREGYIVGYPNPEGMYHSWSPKDVFESAYREIAEAEENLIKQS